jgi:hypothetical protein
MVWAIIGNIWRKTANANEIETFARIRWRGSGCLLMVGFSFAYLEIS